MAMYSARGLVSQVRRTYRVRGVLIASFLRVIVILSRDAVDVLLFPFQHFVAD
jgi:hypothetical protein